eukprot:SM000012S25363  [mRNA]  locus=s12:656971:660204:- [translate_table: standard]
MAPPLPPRPAEALERPAHVQDVDALLAAYEAAVSARRPSALTGGCAQAGPAATLAAFKSAWRARSFALVHEGRPRGTSRARFLQQLYAAALEHLRAGATVLAEAGALYALYCLYHTQPPAAAPVRIYISLAKLRRLQNLAEMARMEGPWEVAAVLRRMLAEHAFLLGAVDCDQSKAVARWAARAREAALNKIMREQYVSVLTFLSVLAVGLPARLLSRMPLSDHLEDSLVEELGLHQLHSLCQAYAAVRQRVFTGGEDEELAKEQAPPAQSELAGEVGAQLLREAGAWDTSREAALKLAAERHAREVEELQDEVHEGLGDEDSAGGSHLLWTCASTSLGTLADSDRDVTDASSAQPLVSQGKVGNLDILGSDQDDNRLPAEIAANCTAPVGISTAPAGVSDTEAATVEDNMRQEAGSDWEEDDFEPDDVAALAEDLELDLLRGS